MAMFDSAGSTRVVLDPASTPADVGTTTCERLDSTIEATVRELRTLTRSATLNWALEVGRTVIVNLYGGDLGSWRQRGRKERAIRTLVRHRDLPLSASALYRALALYELRERLGDAAFRGRLGVSHLRLVLGLEPDLQRKLLTRAEREGWTVLQLESAAHSAKREVVRRGGRPRVPSFVKSIRQLRRLTEPGALDGLDAVEDLPKEVLQELGVLLSEVQDRVHRLRRIIGVAERKQS